MRKSLIKYLSFGLLAILLAGNYYLLSNNLKQKIIYKDLLERQKELLIEQNFLLEQLKIAVEKKVKEEKEKTKTIQATVREVSAYNVGDYSQCSGNPCISANGENICQALEFGYKRCAANFVSFGTILYIENFGECLVTDRLNSKYKNRVDIAMKLNEKEKAILFGIQKRKVSIIQ